MYGGDWFSVIVLFFVCNIFCVRFGRRSSGNANCINLFEFVINIVWINDFFGDKKFNKFFIFFLFLVVNVVFIYFLLDDSLNENN